MGVYCTGTIIKYTPLRQTRVKFRCVKATHYFHIFTQKNVSNDAHAPILVQFKIGPTITTYQHKLKTYNTTSKTNHTP